MTADPRPDLAAHERIISAMNEDERMLRRHWHDCCDEVMPPSLTAEQFLSRMERAGLVRRVEGNDEAFEPTAAGRIVLGDLL